MSKLGIQKTDNVSIVGWEAGRSPRFFVLEVGVGTSYYKRAFEVERI